MLDIFGREYIFDHILAEIKRRNDELNFRIYVTDALKAIAENTTQIPVVNGVVTSGTKMKERYADRLKEKKGNQKPKKEETSEDVIKRIKGGLGKIGR